MDFLTPDSINKYNNLNDKDKYNVNINIIFLNKYHRIPYKENINNYIEYNNNIIYEDYIYNIYNNIINIRAYPHLISIYEDIYNINMDIYDYRPEISEKIKKIFIRYKDIYHDKPAYSITFDNFPIGSYYYFYKYLYTESFNKDIKNFLDNLF